MDDLMMVASIASKTISGKEECSLMCKDTVLYNLTLSGFTDITILQYKKVSNSLYREESLHSILNSRLSCFNRLGIQEHLKSLGISTKLDMLKLTHGVSLSDCLWIKFSGEELSWNSINPYRDSYPFDISWLMEKDSPLYGNILPNYSTDGNFPKCWVTESGSHELIKCGTSGAYNAGIEPVSEVLFYKLAKALGLSNAVEYNLTWVDYKGLYNYRQPILLSEIVGKSDKRLATRCKCFTNENKSLITAKDLGLCSYSECIEFAKKNTPNWYDIILILMCDCIGLNVDRHFGNIGFLYNPDNMKVTEVAPMYDGNLSMLCYYDERENLDYYISDLRAKDGRRFDELAEWLIGDNRWLYENLQFYGVSVNYEGISDKWLSMVNKVVNDNYLRYQDICKRVW